jgi:integrase
MTQKVKLTKRTVDAQKSTGTEYVVWDTAIRGYGLRVHPSGRKTFFLKYRVKDGHRTQIKLNIGALGEVTPDGARKIAENWRDEIAAGGDPRARLRMTAERNEDSFKTVAENFIKRYVEKRGLRSQPEIERQLKVYVYPRWEDRAFLSITRRDVAELLDAIEDRNGATQADRVMATLRKLMNWYQTRDDDFVSPVVKGMARTKPAERKRKRILSDDELRLLWPHLTGTFGALVKVLLLSGQQLGKVSTMRWQDIEDGVWTLPTEPREKNNPGSLKLPRTVLDIIEAQPRIAGCPYVFAGRTKGPMAGISPLKRKLDAAVLKAMREADPRAEPLPHWQLHDLRRTARSLMSRVGVRSEHAERVLGHVLAGVEGVYDRHHYDEEKAEALEALAGLVSLILSPPVNNVTPMTAEQPRL